MAADPSGAPTIRRPGRSIADVAPLFLSRLDAGRGDRTPRPTPERRAVVLLMQHVREVGPFDPLRYVGYEDGGRVAVLEVDPDTVTLRQCAEPGELWHELKARGNGPAAMLEPLWQRLRGVEHLVVVTDELSDRQLDRLVLWAGRACICVEPDPDGLVAAYRLVKRLTLELPGVPVELWLPDDAGPAALDAARRLIDVAGRFCRRQVDLRTSAAW